MPQAEAWTASFTLHRVTTDMLAISKTYFELSWYSIRIWYEERGLRFKSKTVFGANYANICSLLFFILQFKPRESLFCFTPMKIMSFCLSVSIINSSVKITIVNFTPSFHFSIFIWKILYQASKYSNKPSFVSSLTSVYSFGNLALDYLGMDREPTKGRHD